MGERLDQVSALRLWHGALADSVRRDGPDMLGTSHNAVNA
jgi:hypothetical protein